MPDRPPRAVLAGLRARLGAAVEYAAGESLLAFRRNGLMSIAAVTTIMVTLVLVAGALILSTNLSHISRVIEGRVQVVAYLREGLPPAQVEATTAAVRGTPGVGAVRFVGRDEALKRLQESLGEHFSLRDVVETNPLPDSLEVTLRETRRAREIAARIQALPGIEEVAFGAQVLDRLLAVTALLRTAGLLVTVLLACVALIIIMNTIRLTLLGRRQEIEIMQLVGAGGWYVRSPFILEGALEGLLGLVLAAVIVVPGYLFLLARAHDVLPFLPVVPAGELLPALALSLAAAGLLVGTGGSALALRRFLTP